MKFVVFLSKFYRISIFFNYILTSSLIVYWYILNIHNDDFHHRYFVPIYCLSQFFFLHCLIHQSVPFPLLVYWSFVLIFSSSLLFFFPLPWFPLRSFLVPLEYFLPISQSLAYIHLDLGKLRTSLELNTNNLVSKCLFLQHRTFLPLLRVREFSSFVYFYFYTKQVPPPSLCFPYCFLIVWVLFAAGLLWFLLKW